MKEEPLKYEIPEDNPLTANEPMEAYHYAAVSSNAADKGNGHSTLKTGIATHQKVTSEMLKEYLRANLTPATVKHLESVDWMEGKPFPVYNDTEDDSWIDVAESCNDTDIVDSKTVNHDNKIWRSVR